MTAQRKRRGRKPGTILQDLGWIAVCRCNSESCTRVRDLIRELRAALKKGAKT